MLKGMTVEYLLNRSFRVTAEDTVLFHAAAGGVGLIAGQWLRHIGATSIGTVGSDEKLAEAKAAGYTHVINYNTTDFTEAVAEITGGKGVSVAYDSVGQATYPQTLKCLRKFGLFVSFGQSSGVIKNFATGDLAQNGSLYAQRPTLFSFIDTPESLAEVSGNLFSMLADGHVSLSINQRYALKDVPAAFDALINRRTTGATVFDTGEVAAMASQTWKGQAFTVSHADGTGLAEGGFTGGLRAFSSTVISASARPRQAAISPM